MTPEARLRIDASHAGAGQGTAVVPTRNLESQVEQAVTRSREWMLAAQSQDGYWWGELEADTTLESDYILYLHILGHLDSEKTPKLASYIRARQLPDGGWNIFQGGPSELNATVKAYVALRLAGDSADAPHVQRAKDKVLELGGLEATNSYVRFYLAMVGAVDWNMVPSIPPELMLLPDWFAINIYEMSSWTRGIVIPLTILYAHKPQWQLPAGITVDELFKDPGQKPPSFKLDKSIITWRNVFLALDRGLKLYERSSGSRFESLRWNAREMDAGTSGAQRRPGTIYPAMMNSIFALLAEAREADDPLLRAKSSSSRASKSKTSARTRFACSRAFRPSGIRRSRWSRSKKRA